MHIADFSIKNPVLVNLLTGAVIVMGLLFALSLPLEMLPSIKLEAVLVKTPFPDASAEDVENLVSVPIEQEIRNVSGVRIVKSVSSEGLSKVIAELYPGEDITEVAREIDSRVRLITGQLPEDAEEPVAEEVRANSPLVSISIFGDVPKDVLSGYAKEFESELMLLGGIDSIASLGLHDPAFWVNLDHQKMMQFGLDIEQIAAAINRKNLDFPGGAFAQGDIEFLLRTEGKIKSEQDLLNIPIAENTQGKHVLLRDVATVVLGEEKEMTRSRTNGRPSVTFSIRKQKDVDIVSTVSDIRRLVEKYESYMPEEMDIALVNDMSVRVQNRRNTMVQSGVLGFLLVLGILALFIESRAALITAMGIPISFLGALILMGLSGLTLNVLSMFGLIMMLGIIVDDALIVVENVQRHISGGMDPIRAALVGTKEVALPVVGTVMTNIAAFLPLFVATGLVGQFLSVIPKVAVFVLCVSLFEVLLIVPSHCAEWLKAPGATRSPVGSAALVRTRRLYLRGLAFSLRNRYRVIACFAVVFFISVFIFIRMPNVMFYFHDTEQVFVRVENPSYSNLGNTAVSVAEVEEVIVKNIPPHVLKNIVSVVGTDMTDPDNVLTANHLATIIVQYEDYSSRSENALELSLETEDKVWESVTGPKQIDFITNMGPPTGKPVDVKISGEHIPMLMSAASEIQKFLDKLPGVSAVSSDLIYGKPEARVEVDEARAAVFGLDTRRIAREVNVIGGGLTVAKTRIGDDEADINLRYKPGDSGVTATLNSHQILTPLGQWVPLGTVADVTPRLTPLEIRRENARRTVGVTAQIDGEVTTSREVNGKLAAFLGEMMESYPQGYSYRFAGEEEEYGQTFSDVKKAGIAALILIYIILASMLRSYFQPFIVMSVLPLCITGVIFGVLLHGHGEPMSLPAIVGMVALLGIVVNDSMLLLDFSNRRVSRLRSRAEAIMFSAKHRFRPIVLTTVTTFAGLFSLMFVYSGEASFLAPMAVSIGFGLLFATFVVLYLVPCLYLALDDISRLRSANLRLPSVPRFSRSGS